jgi:hypothetical protein
MLHRTLAGLVFSALLSCTPLAHATGLAPSYPLDDVARVLEPGEALPCKTGNLELVSYRGTTLAYQKPMRVHPAFTAQLAAFEAIVSEVSIQHFGRAPRRIVHLGAFACRTMRRYPDWVSEHALGNALDVAGFDFGPLPRNAQAPEDLPKPLRRAFNVRLLEHWERTGKLAPQAAFLRDLAERLIERPDVFHVVLGPAWPGHKNHFHLDHAPYRVVEVF